MLLFYTIPSPPLTQTTLLIPVFKSRLEPPTNIRDSSEPSSRVDSRLPPRRYVPASRTCDGCMRPLHCVALRRRSRQGQTAPRLTAKRLNPTLGWKHKADAKRGGMFSDDLRRPTGRRPKTANCYYSNLIVLFSSLLSAVRNGQSALMD